MTLDFELGFYGANFGMRVLTRVSVGVAFAAQAVALTACSDDFDNCAASRTCPSSAAGAGGKTSGGAGEAQGAAGAVVSDAGGSTGLVPTSDGAAGELGSAGSGGRSGANGDTAAAGMTGTGGAAAGGVDSFGGGSGLAGTGGDAAQAPVWCDPSALVVGCQMDASAGLFVSPSGNDRFDGNATAPLKSVTRALELARTDVSPRPIFVCEGTYDERVTISETGIRLYGGFACPAELTAPWVYNRTSKARLIPTAEGAVMTVREARDLVVEDIDFLSAHATTPGASSLGVFVVDSHAVHLTRTRIDAGDGADGLPGTLEPIVYAETNRAGAFAVDSNGGAGATCSCEGGTVTAGGSGGDSGIMATKSSSGRSGLSGTPALEGGEGGVGGEACGSGGSGMMGATGKRGNSGRASGRLGALDDTGWTPASGESGFLGAVGQGGGGGAGGPGTSTTAGGGGGGGGCGGCGGNGGKGGQGGGGSIALLVNRSEITLTETVLVSSRGGDGGAGGPGQPGQAGANGGKGFDGGCSAGRGGSGGSGGRGSGGAGGISVPLLWAGEVAPMRFDANMVAGPAGSGGPGGNDDESPGLDGISVLEHRL